MVLDHLHRQLSHLAQETLLQHRQSFAALAAALDALSPLKVLGPRLCRGERPAGTF